MATRNTFAWTQDNMACLATYNILEGDQLLNQFDVLFLKFKDAGAVRLSSLPYFPKFAAAPEDIEGRAAQMARRYFKFLITLFTHRKENKATSVGTVLGSFETLFASEASTITDLAAAADGFLKFANEK